jgi:hypothetical protein
MNEATVKITGVKREELIDLISLTTHNQIWHEKSMRKFFQMALLTLPYSLSQRRKPDVLFNGSVYKMMKESINYCNSCP